MRTRTSRVALWVGIVMLAAACWAQEQKPAEPAPGQQPAAPAQEANRPAQAAPAQEAAPAAQPATEAQQEQQAAPAPAAPVAPPTATTPLEDAKAALDRDREALALKEPSLVLSPDSKPAHDRLKAEIKRLRTEVETVSASTTSAETDPRAKRVLAEVKKLEEDLGKFNPPAQVLTDTKGQIERAGQGLEQAAGTPDTPPAYLAGIAELREQVAKLSKEAQALSDAVATKKNTAGFGRSIRNLSLKATAMDKRISEFNDAVNMLNGDKGTLEKDNQTLQGKEQDAKLTPRTNREYAALQARYAALKKDADALTASKPTVASLERSIKKLDARVQLLDQHTSAFSTTSDVLTDARGTLDHDAQGIQQAQQLLEHRAGAQGMIKKLNADQQALQTESGAIGDTKPSDAAGEQRVTRLAAKVKGHDQAVARANSTGQIWIDPDAVYVYPRNAAAVTIPVAQIQAVSYGREALRWMNESDQKQVFYRGHPPIFGALNVPPRKYIGIKYGPDSNSITAVIVETGADSFPVLKQLLAASKTKLIVAKADAADIPKEFSLEIAEHKKGAAKTAAR